MQVYPTLTRSEQNRAIFICHSHTWQPFSFLFLFFESLFLFIWTYLFENPFLFFMREVVSCSKGERKAIQEKSENEGFIIQKTPNPWNRYFESQHFFSFSPFYPHFYIYYSYVSLIFLIQIFILFIFTSISIHQRRERERERERAAKTEYRVGVGGNGGWWVSKLLFGGDSGLCQFGKSNGQWWFRCQFGAECVFYCDGAFLALHVKFRYLVSSLSLWDCLYPIPNIWFKILDYFLL